MAENQEHILVVIADPQMSALFDRVLRSADYTVTLVQDGSSAVKQVTLIGASMVILGERLRDGAGVDCAAEFARRLPALPVVMFANQESPDLVQACDARRRK